MNNLLIQNPPKYAYNYAITGEDKGVQGHHEVRNGINTTGSYYVQTEDSKSDVSYFSDDWGFHPVVKYETKSENSHVKSHFALGKEAVDALNENKDGRFPIPGEDVKSAPLSPQHYSTPRPILPTTVPTYHIVSEQPHYQSIAQSGPQHTIHHTTHVETPQYVTPAHTQDAILSQPHQQAPIQHIHHEVSAKAPVNVHQPIHFVQSHQHIKHEKPIHVTPVPILQEPNIQYAEIPANHKPNYVSINVHHGVQPPRYEEYQPQQKQKLVKVVSTTPRYVTSQDIFNINAAISVTPKPVYPTHESEKSLPVKSTPSQPKYTNLYEEPKDKHLNSISFQHPIVVGEIDLKQQIILSTTSANREYLPPVTSKPKANSELLKIDHNQGQFLKETTFNLDHSHQSLEGDQQMTDTTSAPHKEAPSRYFLRKFKQPTLSPTTIKSVKEDTLVITQRPISNKYLAPVQAGLKLANDDCNDEIEHQQKHVTKTIVEVQKTVNVLYDDRKPQYGARYTPRKPCGEDGYGCKQQVIIQPVEHIVEKKVPVHIETQKIVEKPVPYPVKHFVDKPVPYPVKEVHLISFIRKLNLLIYLFLIIKM